VDRAVVRPLAEPLAKEGGLVALFGSLAPNGAILKRSAADANLFEREGRAVVFSSLDDLAARVDDPKLDIKPEDFMVLQNAGPEVGLRDARGGLPADPAEARARGLKDMVRISDARMSGTAYGTIVLHVSPEAAAAAARAGAQRRPDQAVGRRNEDRPAGCRKEICERKKSLAAAGACRRAATRSSTWTTCSRPSTAAISTFCGKPD
jgi:hypothetical protein